MVISRFEVHFLDPTEGSEIKKTRPCWVISPDDMNQYIQTVIVALMNSQGGDYRLACLWPSHPPSTG